MANTFDASVGFEDYGRVWEVGDVSSNSAEGHSFQGNIDDLVVYRRGLSQSEIQALYGSLGNPGAVTATLYSLLKEGYLQQTGQKRPDPNVFAITATSISPPINSKLRVIG